MEDFGYSKEQQENYLSTIFKKALMFGAALFSIFCFLYITVNAYNYFSDNNAEIKMIEPEADPIKVFENKESSEEGSMQIDHSVYEDIFGTRKEKKHEIKIRENAKNPIIKAEKIVVEEDIKPSKVIETKPLEPEKIIVYSQDKPKTDSKTLLNNPQKSGKKFVRVQIAAMTSRKGAAQFFDELKNQHPEIFNGVEEYIQEIDLGKRGMFYRLQIGNFYDQIRAENFCKKYIAKTNKSRADCIVVE